MLFTRCITCCVAMLELFSMNCLQASSGVKGNRADYVVVGVGTAGSLMAKRLTDDKKTSAIALHSGQNFTDSFIIKYGKNTAFSVLASLLGAPLPFDPSQLNLPPDVQQELQNLIQLSNNASRPLYETGATIPQAGANDRPILWVISLPEAGASSINAGAWCRGTNQQYAKWEATAGPNWSVNRILEIAKKLEHYQGKTNSPNYRGHHGPLHIYQNNPPSQLAKVFTQALISATGFPFVLDYNDPSTPIGVSSQFQFTRDGHKGFFRVSGATAFLNDDVMKPNGTGVKGRKLKVLFNSTALRTIWNSNTAVGVEYVQDGVTKRVFANKGVIVCAGLRSSPFLMYSGVGPAALLTSLGIPVVYENPNVGQGLLDQTQSLVLFSSNPKDSAAGGNSPFSQIAWLPAPGGDPTERQLRFSTIDVVPGVTLGLFDLVQPLSRGSVSINSPNPLDPPVVDLGIFSNPNDLDLYISGYQTYIKALNIQLQAIDPQYQLILPDPAILDDTALLTEYIKDVVGSNQSFESHCRMAPLAQGGVVDSTGRVYGVNNLFVADNSINPQPMTGSTMFTGFLNAENIVELLGY